MAPHPVRGLMQFNTLFQMGYARACVSMCVCVVCLCCVGEPRRVSGGGRQLERDAIRMWSLGHPIGVNDDGYGFESHGRKPQTGQRGFCLYPTSHIPVWPPPPPPPPPPIRNVYVATKHERRALNKRPIHPDPIRKPYVMEFN